MEFGSSGRWRSRRTAASLTAARAEQRALLALLLLHANEVVPDATGCSTTSGATSRRERPPALRVRVSQLRKALARRARRVVARAPGYVLHDRRRTSSTPAGSSGCSRRGARRCGRRPRARLRAAARGARALARARARRLRRRAVRAGRESRGSRSCASPRSRSGIDAELALGRHARARRRARGARRRAAAARAPPGAAHARALPLGPAGRRARRLPGGARGRLVEELGHRAGPGARRSSSSAILRQDPALAPAAPPGRARATAAPRATSASSSPSSSPTSSARPGSRPRRPRALGRVARRHDAMAGGRGRADVETFVGDAVIVAVFGAPGRAGGPRRARAARRAGDAPPPRASAFRRGVELGSASRPARCRRRARPAAARSRVARA